MERRRFLQWGCAAGAAATLAPGLAGGAVITLRDRFRLIIEAVNYELIDGTFVYAVFYFQPGEIETRPDLRHPHPLLRAREGERIEIHITNEDDRPHGFAITGIPAATIRSIAPGETATSRFVAPVGGSYLYHDPLNAPVNRLLGLYGGFLVAPIEGLTLQNSPTPYSREQHTPEVRALFDAFGRITRFPGNQWDPHDDHRDKTWIFSQVDPLLNASVERGDTVVGAQVVSSFLPRYFHINAISGFDTGTHDGLPADKVEAAAAIEPEGRQGQPTLIRTMNAGLVTHSPHIHGNSLFVTSRQSGNTVSCTGNVLEVDTWTLRPLGRVDGMLPFERPADIPVWPPKQEPFPLRYVMHCHTEMSQTAGGGNYPQGCVTHWEITAPLPE